MSWKRPDQRKKEAYLKTWCNNYCKELTVTVKCASTATQTVWDETRQLALGLDTVPRYSPGFLITELAPALWWEGEALRAAVAQDRKQILSWALRKQKRLILHSPEGGFIWFTFCIIAHVQWTFTGKIMAHLPASLWEAGATGLRTVCSTSNNPLVWYWLFF